MITRCGILQGAWVGVVRELPYRTYVYHPHSSVSNRLATNMASVGHHRTTHRRKNHAGYMESRKGIKIVVTEHVDDYRAAVCALLREDTDCVLEIGCAGGRTTKLASQHALAAYGLDKSVSKRLLEEQDLHTDEKTTFINGDAWDIGTIQKIRNRAKESVGKSVSVILLDISGNAKIGKVLDLIALYENPSVLGTPDLRLIVVKSYRFASLMDRSRVFEVETADPPPTAASHASLAVGSTLGLAFLIGTVTGFLLLRSKRWGL